MDATILSEIVELVAQNASQRHFGGVDPSHGAAIGVWTVVDTAKPFLIPVAGLIIGGIMMMFKQYDFVGRLVLYFGAQSFMNIFMGWVMGTHITIPKGTEVNGHVLEENLTGCPAGFALTAMQQVVSFICFIVFFLGSRLTKEPYQPKQLTNAFMVFSVIIFGCVFALNIALNNFSLGYVSIAVNLIIRGCLPLTTWGTQQLLALAGYYPYKKPNFLELFLMFTVVVCAVVFTWAQIQGSGASNASSQTLGVVMCVLSLLCGSLNLVLAGVLGETKFNVYDTVAYMAIPATVFLLPFCFIKKQVPGQWPQVFGEEMSDFEILVGVWQISPQTMIWLILSGLFSFVYNIIQFSIVHQLSPSATALGGNFNKAALIFMTLLLPFLQTTKNPGPPWIYIIWGSVIVNVAAGFYYNYLQLQAKKEKSEKVATLIPGEDPDPETNKNKD